IKSVLKILFRSPSNLFSFEHTYFVEVNNKKAGMVLAYGWQEEKEEDFRTGFLFFKNLGFSLLIKLPILLKLNNTVGKLGRGEYYISNLSVYPSFRRLGIGKMLISECEKIAKYSGAKKIVLDVEKDNTNAISFYKKLDYTIVKEFSIPFITGRNLEFYRMIKTV
ncbi:MAG: GNAT family N-acetyltransferase, partial [Brevinematia bacterium]